MAVDYERTLTLRNSSHQFGAIPEPLREPSIPLPRANLPLVDSPFYRIAAKPVALVLQPLIIAVKAREPPLDNTYPRILDTKQIVGMPVSPTPRRRSDLRITTPIEIQRHPDRMRHRKNNVCILCSQTIHNMQLNHL